MDRRPSRIRRRTAPGGARVQIGMGLEERVLFGSGHGGHAVDVVVAVALDVLEAEEGDEREILLHADAGLRA